MSDVNCFVYNSRLHAYSHTDNYIFSQLIPYIGSKRKLLPLIDRAISRTGSDINPGGSPPLFVDLFAGSGVVSRMAKMKGFRTLANDWEPYALAINGAFIALNSPPLPDSVFSDLLALPPVDGFIAEHYCPKCDDSPNPAKERLFFTRANGMRIDAIRLKIEEWKQTGKINDAQEYYLLAPLLASASYVANTSGVFKAYHAGWGGRTRTALYRILSDLTLSPPPLFDNKQDNIVWRADAFEAAEKLGEVQNLDEAIVYLDPPYNQHPYGSNYHLLNTIALYDRPAIPEMKRGGKSAIRRDWRTSRRSSFNSADAALPSLEELLKVIQARWILCSYSTDGNISIGNLIEAFAKCGEISIETHRYKRYRVSTQRMSPESHNVEFVLVLDKHASPSGQARISECMNAIEEAR